MAVTIADIKTRIETLLGTVPGVALVLTENTDRLITALPAAEVVVRDATRDKLSTGQIVVTRNFEVWLYAAEITKLEDENVLTDALEEGYAWLDTIPDFFVRRERLEYNDSGIAGVSLGNITDSGSLPAPYRGKTYTTIRFQIPVRITRDGV